MEKEFSWKPQQTKESEICWNKWQDFDGNDCLHPSGSLSTSNTFSIWLSKANFRHLANGEVEINSAVSKLQTCQLWKEWNVLMAKDVKKKKKKRVGKRKRGAEVEAHGTSVKWRSVTLSLKSHFLNIVVLNHQDLKFSQTTFPISHCTHLVTWSWFAF